MQTRSLFFSLIVSVGGLAVSSAAHVAVSSLHKHAEGVTFQMKPGVLRLEVFSPRIIRVTADHTDWRLQINTNLTMGNWQDIIGTDATNSVSIPPTNGNALFRLVYP